MNDNPSPINFSLSEMPPGDQQIKCTKCHQVIRKNVALWFLRRNFAGGRDTIACPKCKSEFIPEVKQFPYKPMTHSEHRKMSQYAKSQQREKKLGFKAPKTIWKSPVPTGLIRIEEGGAIESSRRKH